MDENIESIDRAVAVLNEALAADTEAVERLLQFRAPCNGRLAAHPTIQVGPAVSDGSVATLGVLGLINGLFGCGAGGSGYIAVNVAEGGRIIGFVRIRENEARDVPGEAEEEAD